jgi:DNA polymerase III delta prime subunit
VRGHDAVINRMLVRIHENLTLRKRLKHGSREGPLASFMLTGPEGVGKRYLVRVLAKLLYREGTIDVFECDQIAASQLLGSSGSSGELESVRKDAQRILLFEHVDRAPPELARLLLRLLTSGKLRLAGAEADVSFENTIVVFTTTLAVDDLAERMEYKSSEPAWQQQAIECMASATRIDRKLLQSVTELACCVAPADQVKSEVIALLLAKECGAHRTELGHVDPEIIATQVLQLDDEQGFANAPQLVKKLLRKPLVAAAEGDHRSLSLRVRSSRLQHQ